MSYTKPSKSHRKKQVVFMDFKSESLPIINTNNGTSGKAIIAQKSSIRYAPIQSSKTPPKRRLSLKSLQPKIGNNNNEEKIIPPSINKTQSKFEILNREPTEPLNDTIDKSILDKEETIHLLDKIKHSPNADSVGPMPLSLQACRFELPFNLKLLERLTPLDYLTKYCRLSSRRQYQFKRIFDKYRNRFYQFQSSYLYLSLLDIHKQNVTYKNFNYLRQLIDLNDQQYQYTFDTYAGILALYERILYKSSILYKDLDDYNLTKNEIEKCDFYSLDRKFDGLIISNTMKQLLNAL